MRIMANSMFTSRAVVNSFNSFKTEQVKQTPDQVSLDRVHGCSNILSVEVNVIKAEEK